MELPAPFTVRPPVVRVPELLRVLLPASETAPMGAGPAQGRAAGHRVAAGRAINLKAELRVLGDRARHRAGS